VTQGSVQHEPFVPANEASAAATSRQPLLFRIATFGPAQDLIRARRRSSGLVAQGVSGDLPIHVACGSTTWHDLPMVRQALRAPNEYWLMKHLGGGGIS